MNILGLVDDMIGVREVGQQGQELNAILNVKFAEKCLQFGVDKCKTMIIGKGCEKVINSKLVVDGWSEEYFENLETGA